MPEPELVTPSLARRIVAHPLSLLVIGFVLMVAVGGAGSLGLNKLVEAFDVERNSPVRLLGALILAALFIAAYKGFKRWIERAPDRELDFAGAGRELGLGLAFGGGLFAIMTGIVALLGGFEVLGLRGLGALWSMLALAVFSGVFEEILLRGIVFRQIEAWLGSWIALAASSALFGVLHIGNPGATWFSSLAIAIEAGILLGAAYMLTRRLWLAIGIHAAWNFTQGWVFSVPVSGGEAPLGLLITRRVGPDWLTGGDFGLEASVVAMVVATLAGLWLLWQAVRAGQVVPAPWQRSS
ncbi:MAG: CPBP family intramembrane metalloprotease [Novosphingobium sp.]|jgi:membrane protease YdiL (CAAX protease family)|nr:CPBP family intramembrane metalloprotease [Novosphingobium sp.]